MPRKAKRKAPDAKTAIESGEKPIELPETVDEIPKRRGPGRPSKAEVAAREAAAKQATAIDPKTTQHAVGLALTMICSMAKGDAPTKDEVEAINDQAVAVANKYDLGGKALPELLLAASVFGVVISSRQRRMERMKSEVSSGVTEAREPSHSRPQGERENQSLENFLHGN